MSMDVLFSFLTLIRFPPCISWPHLEGPERRGAYIPSLNHRLRLEREQASKPWTEVLKIRSPHCARVGMVCGVRHVRCKRMETCSFPSPTSQSGKGGHPQYPKGFHVEQTELRKRQSPGGWPRMRYENQVRIELSSWCACVWNHFSCVRLCVTLWTVTCQAPLSMGFSGQEYWSRLPCPAPGDLPDSGIKSVSLAFPTLAGGFFNH